jgi:hypothetical protein
MTRTPWLVRFGALAIAVLVTCCSTDPGTAQHDSLELVAAAEPGQCGDSFRQCSFDDDCVAVPVVGCCIVKDLRVPVCNLSTQLCEMVAPEDVSGQCNVVP